MSYQKARRDDSDMIDDPTKWPQWPWLPVKRFDTNNRLECAVVYADDSTNVIFAGLFSIDEAMEPIPSMPSLRRLKADVKQLKYPSVAALVADGWMAD